MSDPVPCREQIAVALLAVYESVATDAGLTIERNRKVAITTAELDRLVLFEGDEQPMDTFTGEDGFELPFLAQVAVNKTGAAGAARCNAVRAKLMQALNRDRTLGGLVRDLQITEPGGVIGVDVDSDDVEGFMQALSVRYATAEGDPFTFSNGG